MTTLSANIVPVLDDHVGTATIRRRTLQSSTITILSIFQKYGVLSPASRPSYSSPIASLLELTLRQRLPNSSIIFLFPTRSGFQFSKWTSTIYPQCYSSGPVFPHNRVQQPIASRPTLVECDADDNTVLPRPIPKMSSTQR
jgi:hypothetical protein